MQDQQRTSAPPRSDRIRLRGVHLGATFRTTVAADIALLPGDPPGCSVELISNMCVSARLGTLQLSSAASSGAHGTGVRRKPSSVRSTPASFRAPPSSNAERIFPTPVVRVPNRVGPPNAPKGGPRQPRQSDCWLSACAPPRCLSLLRSGHWLGCGRLRGLGGALGACVGAVHHNSHWVYLYLSDSL